MKISAFILSMFAMVIAGCGEVEWFPETQRSATTPNTFYFTSVTGVSTGSTQTSNAITVAGIPSGSAPISVSGDSSSQYSINGGAYTKDAGTVNNSDKVTVRHTASSQAGTTVTTTLAIGDRSNDFKSTTKNVADITVAKTAVPQSSFVTSDAIALNCVTGTYTVSVSNGSYSFNGGVSFATDTQSIFIENGKEIYLRHFSSGTSGGQVTTTLTISNGIDSGVITFTSTAE